VAQVLHAGTDNDCGTFVLEHAQSALNQSLISVADIDERLRMLFRVRMRLLHFDPPESSALQGISTSVICSSHAKELARDAVTQATAMVKNENATLPLRIQTTETVAVIGPNANLTSTCDPGNCYGGACDGAFPSLVDAVQQYVPNGVVWGQGCAQGWSQSNDTDDAVQIAAAVSLASEPCKKALNEICSLLW
jgi:beta-glucosidase-like glycosyl hydrolase